MLLTIPQAAARLALSRQRVHKLVTDKRILALRVGRDYMIEESELKRFKRIPRTNGRKADAARANGHKGGRPRKGEK